MTKTCKHVAIIGGGPTGLMAAEVLAQAGAGVTIFEAMPTLGRKFLLAGRGGLNLTHSEELDAFTLRYGAAAPDIAPLLTAFPPAALRQWAQQLGEPTFVGSSGRVFPKNFKTSPLLRAWLRRLAALGVETRLRHRFTGFGENDVLRFETPAGLLEHKADAAIFALGGASWPRLGSNGRWISALEGKGVSIAPLRPANCGFETRWSRHFVDKFAGAPLKSIALTFGGNTLRGEAVITEKGIEGGAVYALSRALREAIAAQAHALLEIDLRPDVSLEALTRRLSAPREKKSLSNFLRKSAGLPVIAIALLREAGPIPEDVSALAARIKCVPLRLDAARPLERAISTAGGVRFDALDGNLMARTIPGVFFAGEMLDWEAPTGGYLLQACFSSGVVAARGALAWLKR